MQPEQFMKIVNQLTPEQLVPFLELYKSYKNDDAAEQAKRPAILRDDPAPEAAAKETTEKAN
jgi:hypothetical protein